MPTYDYLCDDCGHEFEFFQSMTAEPLAECPNCAGNVKRKIGAGLSPIFKGSGFYQTDYKNAKPKQSSAAKNAKPANDPKPSTDTSSASSTPSTDAPKA
jgi:putative FmdB family regulatory protein